MKKPKSKTRVIERLHTERRRLEANLARLSREDLIRPNVVGEWSFKDVLAHLAHWEAFLPDWIAASRRGEEVEVPAPGLTWKDLHILNQRIYEEHCDQSLDDVLEYFRSTHTQFMALAEPFSHVLRCKADGRTASRANPIQDHRTTPTTTLCPTRRGPAK